MNRFWGREVRRRIYDRDFSFSAEEFFGCLEMYSGSWEFCVLHKKGKAHCEEVI